MENIYSMFSNFSKKKQLHAVSCTQQDRQRESSVETLRCPRSAEFWRHCVLNGRIRASKPERRNGNIHLNKYFISSSLDRTPNQSVLQSHFVPLRHDWPHYVEIALMYLIAAPNFDAIHIEPSNMT